MKHLDHGVAWPHAVKLNVQVRPYLMADGGNVEFVEIDGPIVKLKLQGACGSCPSSTTTMTMGIERRLKERIPEILEVEQVEIVPKCALVFVWRSNRAVVTLARAADHG